MARTTLLERQKLNLEKQQSRLSESIQRITRMDTAEFSAALKENENFSWKRLKSNLVANESKLKEATAEDAELVGRCQLAAARIARDRSIEDGYRTVLNVGPRAGQSVFHLHVHLIGGRSLRWPPG